jgi:hypothetical protein
VIDLLFEILGLTSWSVNQELIVFVFCLVLLFFGVLAFLNCVLSIFSNVFKID